MENENLENNTNSTVNDSLNIESVNNTKPTNDSDNIIITEVKEIISDSNTTSTFSLGSSKREKIKVFALIIFVLITIICSFSIVYYYREGDKKIHSDGSAIAAELNKKVAEIDKEVSTPVKDDEYAIKFTLNGNDHIINLTFFNNQATIGNQHHISYDMKLFVDGNLLRDNKYNFDGRINAFYYELVNDFDDLYIENKDMSTTYIYETSIITNSEGNEYLALMIKSSYDDEPKAHVVIIDNTGALAYYFNTKGKYYYSNDFSDENLFGNGYVLFSDNSISYVDSYKNEKKLSFDMGIPTLIDGTHRQLVRLK